MDVEFSKRLAEYAVRNHFGGKAARLAETMGVSQGTVSRWRSGLNRIENENLQRLAEIIEFPIEKLLKGELPAAVAAQNMAYARNNPRDSWRPFPSGEDPELTAAVNWHLRQPGADPEDVELATARVRSELSPGEQLGRKKLALMIQRQLDRVRDLG